MNIFVRHCSKFLGESHAKDRQSVCFGGAFVIINFGTIKVIACLQLGARGGKKLGDGINRGRAMRNKGVSSESHI